MQRTRTQDLKNWLSSPDRKPLVIRGARQVGKTWLVRNLAELTGKQLFEVNFEKKPELISLFTASNDPKVILLNIGALFNQVVDPEKSLLFIDEIQAAPEVFAKLRWFAEDMSELPVVAAGSLLEFMLADHTFSMPVGRINYMHVEPLSFEEFLLANGKQLLADFIAHFEWTLDIPVAIHGELLSLFKEYTIVGGMPVSVASWSRDRSFQKLEQNHHDLLSTYRDDFPKYSSRTKSDRLNEVLQAIPQMLGQKFVYSKVNPEVQATTVKRVLESLAKARVSHFIFSCAGNGVPLAAEIREKYFKKIFLDVGLACTALGLSLSQLKTPQDLLLVNQGGIAEQVVGQILRIIVPYYAEPALFYWQREEKGSNAEIDYLIQHENQVVPIEVKSGTTGSLKSLHLFMGLKKLSRAVRVNADFPNITQVRTKDSYGNAVEYELLSMPFYLLSQVHRLLALKARSN